MLAKLETITGGSIRKFAVVVVLGEQAMCGKISRSGKIISVISSVFQILVMMNCQFPMMIQAKNGLFRLLLVVPCRGV
jgi:hypothetical protein